MLLKYDLMTFAVTISENEVTINGAKKDFLLTRDEYIFSSFVSNKHPNMLLNVGGETQQVFYRVITQPNLSQDNIVSIHIPEIGKVTVQKTFAYQNVFWVFVEAQISTTPISISSPIERGKFIRSILSASPNGTRIVDTIYDSEAIDSAEPVTKLDNRYFAFRFAPGLKFLGLRKMRYIRTFYDNIDVITAIAEKIYLLLPCNQQRKIYEELTKQ